MKHERRPRSVAVRRGEELVGRVGAHRTPSPADIALLWAAASPAPVAADVLRATEGGADISFVLETAASHRIAPLVLRSLELAGVRVENRPTTAAERGVWRAHGELALPLAARTALAPLTEAGLEPLVMKGLALVDRYPGSGLRPMDDIDVLLPRADMAAAADALQRAGWVRGRHHRTRDPGYDLAFRHPVIPSVPLELHYESTEQREIAPGLDGRTLWTSRVPATILGSPAWVLPPEIELAALIAHAAKGFHLFSRLLWIADLVVVERSSTLDWDDVERRLARARRRTAGAIALRLAQRLGADVPEHLRHLPPAFERSSTLRAILDLDAPFVRMRRPRWMAYLMVDGILGRLRFVAGDLRQPPEEHSRVRIATDVARLSARGLRLAVGRPS